MEIKDAVFFRTKKKVLQQRDKKPVTKNNEVLEVKNKLCVSQFNIGQTEFAKHYFLFS